MPPNATGRQPISRSQISNQQRQHVRTEIFKQRVRRIPRRNANFALSTGSHVPRHFRLHRLWPAIFAVAPLYYGYSYLAVDDTICVVDPETYIVVDVIPAAIEEASPPARPTLALSQEEMQFVYASVPKDMARDDLHIRLALGATVPRDVELARFPAFVLARLPQLEGFRYVVVDADVVIVDPADRSVVLVINA
jgi:hypothetical protein